MNFKLVTIQDCAEVRPGFSAKGAIGDEPGGTVQVITAQHITKGEPYRYREEHRLLIAPPRSITNYQVEAGDILFMSRGSNNYAVLLEAVPPQAIAPLTFYVLRPKSHVVPAYLAWTINQEAVKARLNELRTGAGTPIIPRKEFGEIPIPLPPLEVQRQIAQLAELQVREYALLQQLLGETERRNRLLGFQLLSNLSNKYRE